MRNESRSPFYQALISVLTASVAVQAVGVVRQILIAGYFGISRDLDIFYVTLALATTIAFSLGNTFDAVVVQHLVETRNERGESAFRQLAGSCVTSALAASSVVAIFFVAIVPALARLVTTGFDHAAQKQVANMSLYFVPWIIISLPYNAIGASLKSLRLFRLVFGCEIIVSVVTTLFLILVHNSPKCLPIAFFVGYSSGLLILAIFSRKHFSLVGSPAAGEMRGIYRTFLELVGANQIGTLSSLIDRFLQSYLAVGGISALSYSNQLTTSLSSLLGFREIFIVPLSEPAGRALKFERIIIGLSIISVPIMIFVHCHAETILTLLFHRGRFDENAVHLTGLALSIYILALFPLTTLTPIFRMFQVIGGIRMTAYVYAVSAVTFLALGALLVLHLGLGVTGLAAAYVINGYICVVVSIILLHKCGIAFNYVRIARYFAYIMTVALSAVWVLERFPYLSQAAWTQFILAGCLYCLLIGISCLPISRRIIAIVRQ